MGRGMKSRGSRSNQRAAARFSVSDGRLALGVVERVGDRFTAIDLHGVIIGTFASLREAAAALPASSSTPASATPEPKSLT
jgi:hypothetical protein